MSTEGAGLSTVNPHIKAPISSAIPTRLNPIPSLERRLAVTCSCAAESWGCVVIGLHLHRVVSTVYYGHRYQGRGGGSVTLLLALGALVLLNAGQPQ